MHAVLLQLLGVAVHNSMSPSHVISPINWSLCSLMCVQEVNDIRAGMEKAKNDIIKSTIAIMGTFSAIAFTITRLVSA
jgi:hypothetical protein